jgi:hypothetical protein
LVIYCREDPRALKKALLNLVSLIHSGLNKIVNPLALIGCGTRGTNDEGNFHGLYMKNPDDAGVIQ